MMDAKAQWPDMLLCLPAYINFHPKKGYLASSLSASSIARCVEDSMSHPSYSARYKYDGLGRLYYVGMLLTYNLIETTCALCGASRRHDPATFKTASPDTYRYNKCAQESGFSSGLRNSWEIDPGILVYCTRFLASIPDRTVTRLYLSTCPSLHYYNSCLDYLATATAPYSGNPSETILASYKSQLIGRPQTSKAPGVSHRETWSLRQNAPHPSSLVPRPSSLNRDRHGTSRSSARSQDALHICSCPHLHVVSESMATGWLVGGPSHCFPLPNTSIIQKVDP
ncbi:hypothetical protein GGR50DRAFT_345133 [Xylaria sp. CBS 124048]|nr:hypothetical protein GGR50DRAFT_345133 [Xylaria sp. CBS 124048]